MIPVSRLALACCIAAALCPSPRLLAAEREVYTLFVELREPHEANRATLQKMLKTEGYEASPEGDREVSIALTAADLKKLFSARVVRRTIEKSATAGTASRPFLEDARIPARFEKIILRVYFDPQRG